MSLDKDIRERLQEKYDPAMADEAKEWIEHTLGESLPQDDLIDSLSDGTVLCRLLNIVTPGSTKYKVSKMPFVQVRVYDSDVPANIVKMENIATFLDGAKVILLFPVQVANFVSEARRTAIRIIPNGRLVREEKHTYHPYSVAILTRI